MYIQGYINWKHVATTPGYKSLKAAYIKDVQEAEWYRIKFKQKPMREKAEFLKKFKWVIGRAMHYAHTYNRPIEDILWSWESDRKGWWLNYYQDCRQPKKRSVS
jgi:hypothetical protein